MSSARVLWVVFCIALIVLALQVLNLALLGIPQVMAILGKIPLLDFSIAWNQGVAFGLGHGENLRWVLIFISGLICISFFLFGLFIVKNGVGTVLVVSGGLSNMIDRLIYGAVLDFVSFDFINFPLFNLSDVLISSGMLYFIFGEFRRDSTHV